MVTIYRSAIHKPGDVHLSQNERTNEFQKVKFDALTKPTQVYHRNISLNQIED